MDHTTQILGAWRSTDAWFRYSPICKFDLANLNSKTQTDCPALHRLKIGRAAQSLTHHRMSDYFACGLAFIFSIRSEGRAEVDDRKKTR